ncbi:GGDEF domain-containing protein [Metasolibacillus meyeri]|uniref:GGDEF domain-containing protein n=1 Tax=Metasolibacillus meyeri TaxID=1071052 RepID=UPI000D326C43|nr:diguanylate cyclase [Metasolibacillus meyeri]
MGNFDKHFFHYLTENNITRVKYAARIAIILELSLLARNIYYYGFSLHYYVQLYLSLLIVSVITLLGIHGVQRIKLAEKRYNLAQGIMFAYYLFTLLWGVTITLIDQKSYGHVTVYLTNLVIVATLFICNKRTFFAIHIIPVLVLIMGFLYIVPTGKALSGHMINISFFWIFIIIAAYSMFKQTENNYKQRLLLNEQNEELIALNQNLEFYANRDPLTQLANRYYLERYVNNLMTAKQNMAIFIFDIDSFKTYNDFYGHPKGDKVLQAVGRTLAHFTEEQGLLACRFGGEEFLVVGLDISTEDAAIIAENIRTTIEELQIPHEKSEVSAYITVSLGYVVQEVENNEQFDECLDLADQALYMAKKAGRNQTAFLSK